MFKIMINNIFKKIKLYKILFKFKYFYINIYLEYILYYIIKIEKIDI
jgi:hypothetical protein